MIQQTIDELRKLKDDIDEFGVIDDGAIFTINKAIIMCERCRRYRKKAKRWKRKYLMLKGGIE